MTTDPTYSRESLESVIAALQQIKSDRHLQRELGLFIHDIDQAVAFMEVNLDAENVADSLTTYLTIK